MTGAVRDYVGSRQVLGGPTMDAQLMSGMSNDQCSTRELHQWSAPFREIGWIDDIYLNSGLVSSQECAGVHE